MVSRAEKRWAADFWPIRLRDRLPVISVPLRPPDAAALVDLHNALHRTYDGPGYVCQAGLRSLQSWMLPGRSDDLAGGGVADAAYSFPTLDAHVRGRSACRVDGYGEGLTAPFFDNIVVFAGTVVFFAAATVVFLVVVIVFLARVVIDLFIFAVDIWCGRTRLRQFSRTANRSFREPELGSKQEPEGADLRPRRPSIGPAPGLAGDPGRGRRLEG